MFNQSIVSAEPRAPGFSLPLGSAVKALLLVRCPLLLAPSLNPRARPSAPSPTLHVYSFICCWLIPHYRDRSTDKRNVLGNTQYAPPTSRAATSPGHWRRSGKRVRRTVRRIFSAPTVRNGLFPLPVPSFVLSSPLLFLSLLLFPMSPSTLYIPRK